MKFSKKSYYENGCYVNILKYIEIKNPSRGRHAQMCVVFVFQTFNIPSLR